MKEFRSIRYAARMTMQIILIALPLFIARAVPASAEPVTWYLTGVTFAGGGSATGWLVYNATTLSVTNWDITVGIDGWHLSGTENPFTFTPANSVAYTGFASLPHDEAYFLFQTPYEPPPSGVMYELELKTSAPWPLTPPGPAILIPYLPTYAGSEFDATNWAAPGEKTAYYGINAGQLTTGGLAVPEPSTFLLLFIGLGAVGLIAWRRGN